MKPKVYISIGSAATSSQKQAADVIFHSLETAGLSPRQMERNEWTAEQPLRGIKRVIDQCQGVVVIAFRRYQFPDGSEIQKNGTEKKLSDVRITTVWNQIEAALGYSRGLPLLVIAEEGLLEDGLIEGRYDWKVYWTDFSVEQVQSDRFIGYLESWKHLVISQSVSSSEAVKDNVDVSKLTIGQLFSRLTVSQLWGAISAIIGLLVGVASISYKIGSHRWPWQSP